MQFDSDDERARFEKYIQDVATATLEHGGSASSLRGYLFLPPEDIWSFPKYPSKTAILPANINLVSELKEFVFANEPFLKEADCWLGTWINPNTKDFYFDIATGYTDFEQAKAIAMAVSKKEGRNIVAMYNPKRVETFYLMNDK